MPPSVLPAQVEGSGISPGPIPVSTLAHAVYASRVQPIGNFTYGKISPNVLQAVVRYITFSLQVGQRQLALELVLFEQFGRGPTLRAALFSKPWVNIQNKSQVRSRYPLIEHA